MAATISELPYIPSLLAVLRLQAQIDNRVDPQYPMHDTQAYRPQGPATVKLAGFDHTKVIHQLAIPVNK